MTIHQTGFDGFPSDGYTLELSSHLLLYIKIIIIVTVYILAEDGYTVKGRKIPCIHLMREAGYLIHISGIKHYFLRGIVQPFLSCNADEFVGGPGHVASLVVADSQDAVSPGVV